MTKLPTDRRTVLMTAGVAAFAAAAGPAHAQSTELGGIVTLEGDAPIPEGRLEIYLEDPAVRDTSLRRLANLRLESDGRSKSIAFSLPGPPTATASPTLRIVARLERADGWLIARGSAEVDAAAPVYVTLSPVMY